jgi:hypothetical protein
MSPGQQEILRPVLVRLGSASRPGASTWRALVEASADRGEADGLLKALRQAGLIIVSTHEVGERAVDDRVVRPVHDSLKDWDVLAEWIKQEKDQLEYLRRLEERAREWVRFGRKNYGLLSQLEYLKAEEWLGSPENSKCGASEDRGKFVEASRRRNRREVQFLRVVATGSVIAAAIIFVLGLFAWNQRNEATDQRDRAVLQGDLNRLGYVDAQMARLKRDADSLLTRSLQLKRSKTNAQRENPTRVQQIQ